MTIKKCVAPVLAASILLTLGSCILIPEGDGGHGGHEHEDREHRDHGDEHRLNLGAMQEIRSGRA